MSDPDTLKKSDEDNEISETESKGSELFRKVKNLERELEETKKEYTKVCTKLKNLKETRSNRETREKIENLNENLNSGWIECEFPWSEDLKTLLKDKFNFDQFRPKQLAAINATLSRKDVLLVMPTGGGKSLVYQLPALIDKGFTLVVSPLISLIQDQLIGLAKMGIKAASINSQTPKEETNKIYHRMCSEKSDLKLVYVTPEWIAKSKRFMSNLKKSYEAGLLARVAIDEVHCCSSWGHDFRPDYGYLGILRTTLASVPFIGLTATATMSVITDVQTMLSLADCMIITAPFNRPNLYYEVVNKPSTKDEVLDYVTELLETNYKDESGIIYTTTIAESCTLASDLRSRGLSVAPYHAQLEPHEKKLIHQKWQDKQYQAVVATVAFGMGIDKPDVRFVIHHTIPRSMESLYQESGRAGRDGANADCIVMFSLNDHFRVLGMVSSLIEEKKAITVLEYCMEPKSCRRALLATEFEEVWNAGDCNEMCDHCRNRNVDCVNYDLSKFCRNLHFLIDVAHASEIKMTLNKLMDGLYHTGPKRFRMNAIEKPNFPRMQTEQLIAHLLLNKYLSIEKGYNIYSTICYIDKGPNKVAGPIEMLSKSTFQDLATLEPSEPLDKKIKLEVEIEWTESVKSEMDNH